MARTPQAVTRAAKLADDKHREAYPAEPIEEQEGETPPEEPPVEPKAEETPPPQEKQPEQAPDWEQRYKSLQGKYNREVPEMAARLRALEERNAEIARTNRDLETRLAEAAKPQQKSTSQETLVTDEEKEEYGEEFTAFIERIAKQAAQPKAQDLTAKPAEAPKTTPQPALSQTVYQTLDASLPSWRQVNRTPEFIGWLQGIEPLSGSPRQTMLNQAFGQGDARRVLAFFNQYVREELGGQAPQLQPQTTTPAPAPSTPQPEAKPGKLSMQDLAGPRESAPTGAPQPKPEAHIWTGAEIDSFYKDVQRGHFKNDPEGKKKIEAQIGKALADGRVRPR